ncbi:MipA/OmpV family protein [Caballeronia mineralivorans]|uniref:MipA/OmpV family protein n=1 Tax=Caballeronia mineralivorans TaxID=2010198 RepID=UPI00069ECFA2|nr:MipA/OmpV family protein [Caballeronia mineralivorans]
MRYLRKPGPRHLLLSIAMFLPLSNAMADTDAPAAPDPSQNDKWHFTVGAGVFSEPKYPGASDRKFQPVPLLGASYGRYFIGASPDAETPLGLGAYLYRDSHWRVGAVVSYDFIKPRKESDDSHLRGLGDIDRTAHASVFVNYTLAWLTARSSVSTDIGGKHQGTTATVDLEAKYSPIERLTLTAGPGLTWASSQYEQTFYGVTAAQSALSGLRQYSPKSGISSVRFSVGASYRLTDHWNVGTRVTASNLRGDAGNSPVVEKKDQIFYGAFASYRF